MDNNNLDIILVSYNSQKWIEKCLASIEGLNFPLEKLHVTFVDNHSADGSRIILEEYRGKSNFGSYNLYFLDENIGFGAANNFGVKNTKQPYVMFLNVDTELEPDAIRVLMETVQKSDEKVALWECRQFPFEHPKIYNPVTMETSWSSAAACLVKRNCFEQVGCFDENIFMYCEDVDLSWRLRAHGYKTVYVPGSIVYHYTYEKTGEVKPSQFYNTLLNNLMLRYKFGNLVQIISGYLLYLLVLVRRGPFSGHRKILVSNLFKSFFLGFKFRKWKRTNKGLGFKPDFYYWDFEITRNGAFYHNQLPEQKPLVSILVRTCGRPQVLRETLKSIQNQTYKNIEIVVVEDGPDVARKMIEEEFNGLNIVYHATTEKVGRSAAGNIAMEMAKGRFLNFLDDDDLFYADHVEVLCAALLANPDYKAAYSMAFETPIEIYSRVPYQYKVLYYQVQYDEKFNYRKLLHHNYFPIQSVMFTKDIYLELSGFDLTLEVYEDWDLWLRYATKHDFFFVAKLTSIYRVPANSNDVKKRLEIFDQYLDLFRIKHQDKLVLPDVNLTFEEIEALYAQEVSFSSKIKKMPKRLLLLKMKYKIYYTFKNLF